MAKSITANLKYLRITPRKTRLVADLIKGLSVNEAESRLMFSPRRPSVAILKLLRSAIANAKHNAKVDADKLYVKEIRVDQGTKVKHWTPRARGGASAIEKRTSHVTITLEVSDKLKAPRFVFKEKPKKTTEKKGKAKSSGEKKSVAVHEEDKKHETSLKTPSKKGLFQKFFRRKSI